MANLTSTGYTFDSAPTLEEVERFEYAAYGYFDANPGYISNEYVSFVGIYYNEAGVRSGVYVANNSVEQYS